MKDTATERTATTEHRECLLGPWTRSGSDSANRSRRTEAGYSLVEVLVSIVLLSIAIIPMVGMFDRSLASITTSSNYDKARTLASLKLEEAKSLPYEQARDNFPETAPTAGPTYNPLTGFSQSDYKTVTGATATVFAGFEYRVDKQFLAQPPLAPSSSSEAFANSASDAGMLKVTVTVRWGGGKTYSTSGVVSK